MSEPERDDCKLKETLVWHLYGCQMILFDMQQVRFLYWQFVMRASKWIAYDEHSAHYCLIIAIKGSMCKSIDGYSFKFI